MNKNLTIAGIIIVNDVIDFRNVKTSGSHISDNEEGSISFPEHIKRICSTLHVHFTIDTITLMQFSQKRKKIVYMKSSGNKNDNFLFFGNVCQKVKKCCCFLFRSNN